MKRRTTRRRGKLSPCIAHSLSLCPRSSKSHRSYKSHRRKFFSFSRTRSRRIYSESQTKSRTPYAAAHKTFAASPHRRPARGIAGQQYRPGHHEHPWAGERSATKNRPAQAKTSRYYERETTRDDYDDTAGEEDELANTWRRKCLRMDRDVHVWRHYVTRIRPCTNVPTTRKSSPEKRPANHENAASGIRQQHDAANPAVSGSGERQCRRNRLWGENSPWNVDVYIHCLKFVI